MKTLSTVVVTALFLAVSSVASADGTKIEKSTLYSQAITTNSANVALGKESTANTGSISIRNGAHVKDSTIFNGAITTNSANVALGDGSNANTGSIDIK